MSDNPMSAYGFSTNINNLRASRSVTTGEIANSRGLPDVDADRWDTAVNAIRGLMDEGPEGAVVGVYRLVDRTDPNDPIVVRTGRTNDLVGREAEHDRSDVLGDFAFEVIVRTDNYNEQRGVEALADAAYPDAELNLTPALGATHPYRGFLQETAVEAIASLG